MDDARIALYYLCSVACFVMVVGGIWLIYREKIYIDRESQKLVEVQTPLGASKATIQRWRSSLSASFHWCTPSLL